MTLEKIAKTYGMVDYLDQSSNYIYELSQAIDNGDGTLKVPVKENGVLIGYSTMNKVKED